MARPTQTGLKYYNVDTDRYQDVKIKRLKKSFGCIGLSVWDYVLTEIYRVKGCFIMWDENTAFDVADYFNLNEKQVNEVINYCCKVGLFDSKLRASGSILTSFAIQERYTEICRRAKIKYQIPKKYLIKSTEEIPKSTEDFRESTEEIPKSTEESTQSKVKESKEKKREEGAPPPKKVLGMEKVTQIAKEVFKDTRWLETMCFALNVKSKDELKQIMASFNASVSSDAVYNFDVSAYKKMFNGWSMRKDFSKILT